MNKSVASVLSGAELDTLCVNTIRFLSIDAVQRANSGHPGLPMGAAPMAYVLRTRFLRHNPSHPEWVNRDRFILSAGHGSMLLYSLLHLTGYAVPLEEIQRFRQWQSLTPGHPERGLTPGVETTTGPLGQGFGNGVGMAMAEAALAARYNRPGYPLIDHYTYALVSDGDLMEGVAAEAASLAGHLQLGKLIYLYDDNRVTLSAATDLTFTENIARRFEAYGWHTQSVADGNDLEAIDRALRAAREATDRPSLILVRTHLGYGAPHKQDTFAAHGSPLGAEEVRLTKQHLGWPLEPPFYIPEPAREHFRGAVAAGQRAEAEWERTRAAYGQAFPELAKELNQVLAGEFPAGWETALATFPTDAKGLATRVAAGKALAAVAPRLPNVLGGSADLNPSTHTLLQGLGDFESPGQSIPDPQGAAGGGFSYAGRNAHFGVREHAMGAILNGLAAHGGILPFGATFLIFSDYLRPAIRLAAVMEIQVLYLFTHDSIGLGEGRDHPPTRGATGQSPGRASPLGAPARRCQRDGRGPPGGPRDARSPSGSGAHQAGRAHPGPDSVRPRGGGPPGGVYSGGGTGWQAGGNSDRHRIGSWADRGCAGGADHARRPGPTRLDAELGAVRSPVASISRVGIARLGSGQIGGGGGCHPGVVPLRRRVRGHCGHRSFRRVGSWRGADAGVRLYRPGCLPTGVRRARSSTRGSAPGPAADIRAPRVSVRSEFGKSAQPPSCAGEERGGQRPVGPEKGGRNFPSR